MFDPANTAESAAAGDLRERLRGQLRERLTRAAEFATLGAYELLEPADRAPAPHSSSPAPAQRVFLFTRAPQARCARGAERPRLCTAQAGPGGAAVATRPGGRRTARPRRRRGGSVEAAVQPCLTPVGD